jgi:hypothetical protein
VLLAPLSAAAEGASQETLFGCRKIEAAAERLACYDRVVDLTRRDIEPAAPEGAPWASSLAQAPEDDADRTLRERLFGRSAGENAAALRRTFGVEAPTRIESKAAAVARTADRRVEVTLENGQVWQQEEMRPFSLRAGDPVEIDTGALGAYYLRRNGKGREIRVRRVR